MSKKFLRTILKLLKSSFRYATDVVEFIRINPAIKVKLPRYDAAPIIRKANSSGSNF